MKASSIVKIDVNSPNWVIAQLKQHLVNPGTQYTINDLLWNPDIIVFGNFYDENLIILSWCTLERKFQRECHQVAYLHYRSIQTHNKDDLSRYSNKLQMSLLDQLFSHLKQRGDVYKVIVQQNELQLPTELRQVQETRMILETIE